MTKERLRKIMGENIRKERITRNMSIDELAELLELTSGFVGLIERGRRGATAYTLYKLSDIFNIPVDTLFQKPGTASSLKVEEGKSQTKSKRNKINSLMSDMNEIELDFVINTIKGVRSIKDKTDKA